MRATKRLVVLISGTGATLHSVIDAARWQTLDAEVVAVFSHDQWGYGLLRAEREGIPALLHDLASYRAAGKSERNYSEDLADRVAAYEPDLVVLADWKHPLTEHFFERFPNHVINLYQGLPGNPLLFDPYGQNPVSRAFEAYKAGLIYETHITVQILNSAERVGEVIAQVPVPIYDFDSLIDLEERTHRTKQELLVNTLHLLLRNNADESASSSSYPD